MRDEWRRRQIFGGEIVTVRKSVLGGPCGSLANEREHIIAALDLLFSGF